MRVVVVAPPAPVVDLAEAKAHLKVRHAVDDALIEGMVAAATQSIDGPDGWLGRALGVQTLEASFDTFETINSTIRLPYPPAIDLISIGWRTQAGEAVEGRLADFRLIGNDVDADTDTPPWSGMKVGRGVLRVRYTAGYATIPAPIRAAILLMVGDLYRNRETVTAVSMSAVPMSASVETLLNPFRVYA